MAYIPNISFYLKKYVYLKLEPLEGSIIIMLLII